MPDFIRECLDSIDEHEVKEAKPYEDGLTALRNMSRDSEYDEYQHGDPNAAASDLVAILDELPERVAKALALAGPYLAPSLNADFKKAISEVLRSVKGPNTPTLADIQASHGGETDRGGAGNTTDSGTSPGNTHPAAQTGDGLVM